jgi:hypothetical protein
MIYTNYYESPLGSILLAGDEQGLTGLWFTEGARYIGLGSISISEQGIKNYICQIQPAAKEDALLSVFLPGFLRSAPKGTDEKRSVSWPVTSASWDCHPQQYGWSLRLRILCSDG